MEDPEGNMPVSSECSPRMAAGPSASPDRCGGSSPQRPPPTDAGVESATRRMRAGAPKGVFASALERAAPDLADGEFRNTFSL